MANHSRSEWSDVYASFTPMGQADGLAIHHTASVPEMQTFDPAYLRRIEHGELASGYNALAYHTMFMLDGDSAESRPYGAMGAATGGHNGHTIAFCVPGYFHYPYYDQPTPQLLRAMAEEIKVLKYLGFLTQYPTVREHAWWTAGTQWATSCCGSELIPWVDDVEAMSYDNWTPNTPAPPVLEEPRMYIAVGRTIFGVSLAFLASGGRVFRTFNGPEGIYGIPQDAIDWRSGGGRDAVPYIYVDPAEIHQFVAPWPS